MSSLVPAAILSRAALLRDSITQAPFHAFPRHAGFTSLGGCSGLVLVGLAFLVVLLNINLLNVL